MLMVVFGAGASYDSDPDRPAYAVSTYSRPPLARSLFAPQYGGVIDQYPACRALVPRLRRAAHDDTVAIEQEFQAILTEAANRRETIRQLAATRYYIRAMIEGVTLGWMNETHGVTNYHVLVDRLDTWAQLSGEAIVYVTFNYDTLLDTALEDALRFRCTDMSHYVSNERIRLIKLHGSTNWRRLAQNPAEIVAVGTNVGNWAIDRYADLQLITDYEVASPLSSERNHHVTVPAIAIPTETKGEADFELPPEHIEVLKGLIPHITRVIVVGWRGKEAHFTSLWRQARGNASSPDIAIIDATPEHAREVGWSLVEAKMTTREPHAMPWRGFTEYMRESDWSTP